ncbi:YgaP family membrane protein [Candidatus Venteria ishoeyi]|uniref:Inner membrane protein YgaP-like transmembrane domain-containing protein n=1 Tax=Candidatus Venteria ishoeyi TaxID=1899563 RepID=A0A1H6FGD1_9GAMM|nr:DUF2892 domain-containing protein [Candidatus Venteria ishoeyi]MDM8546768.1 DUF2892 domain-containing protein [Candidatus Venteria ishoeyi]SEH09138.1 Uncharacterised protein [Candidatus Venteria ishoeyi]SEH09267.1 Uncharacterised protein [Candidatus Venteria ishoeyi]
MNSLLSFMASPAGRIIRILAGGGLIAWGLLGVGGNNGMMLAAIGALPMLTGIFNICLFAPLLGAPLSGSKASEHS